VSAFALDVALATEENLRLADMRQASSVSTHTARGLLERARAKHNIVLEAPRPVIRSLEPSTARWGATIVIAGEFPAARDVRVMLRWRDRVMPLDHRAANDGRIDATLPQRPDQVPGRITAELFVSTGNTSASCGIALLAADDAPVRHPSA